MNERAITAVVPVWNRREWVAPVITTLRAQSVPPDEIVVVDNGSTDGAAEEAVRLGAAVVRMGCNAGFSRAVNRGIREARTPWVAVVNNDVTLDPLYFSRLLDAAQDGSTWFATGKIFRAGSPGVLDGTWDTVCRGGCAWRAGEGRPDSPEFAQPRRIWFAPWTAALFRTSLFARTDYLDETFESFLEDVEFGLRCAGKGLAGVYEPRALAWHQGSGTLGRWHADTVRRVARNQVWLVARHFEHRFSWPVLAAQTLWGGLALRHGHFWAWLRGKWQGVAGARRIGRMDRDNRLTLVKRLAASESEIYTVQRATGFDFYWRMYFLFAGRGAK